VDDDLRVAGEPGGDGRVLMGDGVVRDHVHPIPPWDPGDHVGEGLQPVDDPVVRGRASDNTGDWGDGGRIARQPWGPPLPRPGRPGRRVGPVRVDDIPADDQRAVHLREIPAQHVGETRVARDRTPV